MNLDNVPRGPLRDYNLWTLLDGTGFAVFRLLELELVRAHLTVEQLVLLKHLATESTTPRQVAQSTLRQQSTVSILIRRMAAAGLVRRERLPGTRESRILTTGRGRILLTKATTASLDTVFGDLETKDKEGLCGVLYCLEGRARELLAPYAGPFLQYINGSPPEQAPAQPRGPSNYGLWLRLDGARFAVSRLRELELARFGVTVEQATVLMVLHGGAALTSKHFEDITLRQHHSVSTLVARMVKMGLVERHRPPGGRAYHVSAADKGKQLFDGITTTAIELAFARLTEDEKRYLAGSLFHVFTKARHLLGASHVPSLAALWGGQTPA